MGGMFSKPKMPKPVEPPPLPVTDEVALNRNNADMLLRRRGRAATDLTSGQGGLAGATASAAQNTLLGS